jgi:hypothetical protein
MFALSWTESDIAPCKSNQIRIWVHDKDESQSSFQFPEKIEAANEDALAISGYRPHKLKAGNRRLSCDKLDTILMCRTV